MLNIKFIILDEEYVITSYILQHLCKKMYNVSVFTPNYNNAAKFKTMGFLGQVEVFKITDFNNLKNRCQEAQFVINCALNPSQKNKNAQNVINFLSSKSINCDFNFIHISSFFINLDNKHCDKNNIEEKITTQFKNYCIVQAPLIYSKESQYFEGLIKFIKLASLPFKSYFIPSFYWQKSSGINIMYVKNFIENLNLIIEDFQNNKNKKIYLKGYKISFDTLFKTICKKCEIKNFKVIKIPYFFVKLLSAVFKFIPFFYTINYFLRLSILYKNGYNFSKHSSSFNEIKQQDVDEDFLNYIKERFAIYSSFK